ncbi:MAG: ribosomal RNA small subunit methyltransferase A [Elusimicrobia bacterium]|nr:ribosomal RNA small subunit methyltransferase A [Elusimicrobiota bacterium]
MPARLGQHFLVREDVRDAIVSAAGLRPGEKVLEIGPGRGILTRGLLSAGAEVTAVEMDERLGENLVSVLGAETRLRLIQRDFLKLPLQSLGQGPFKIVANLPYAVATPILQKILPWPLWTQAILMFQKEVGERLAAGPGSGKYGLLTLSAWVYAEVEMVLDVPRECFSPKPKVESAVLRLTRRAEPEVAADKQKSFFKTARAAFEQRRKMASGPIARALGISREQVISALGGLGIGSSARAEEIAPESYRALSEALSRASSKDSI